MDARRCTSPARRCNAARRSSTTPLFSVGISQLPLDRESSHGNASHSIALKRLLFTFAGFPWFPVCAVKGFEEVASHLLEVQGRCLDEARAAALALEEKRKRESGGGFMRRKKHKVSESSFAGAWWVASSAACLVAC